MSAPTQQQTESGKSKKDTAALITVKLTGKEIELLAQLASDQLFRREFIDPKMPGNRTDSSETSFGKNLVVRLRALVDNGRKTLPAK